MNLQQPALDRNGEAWALAASVASDGLFYFDGSDHKLHLAPRAMELLGYAAQAVAPSLADLKALTTVSDATSLERTLMELWRGERQKVESEVQIMHPGAQVRWLQVRARRALRDDGTSCFVAGSLCDIDHRKHAELALRNGDRKSVV